MWVHFTEPTVKIAEFPAKRVKPVTKSRDIWDQGWLGPGAHWVPSGGMVCAGCRLGRLRRTAARLPPQWATRTAVGETLWFSGRLDDRSASKSVTNAEIPTWMAFYKQTVWWASTWTQLICRGSSYPLFYVAKKEGHQQGEGQNWGQLQSRTVLEEQARWCLMLQDPGWQENVKFKGVKNRDHGRELSHFAVQIYLRFLWLVQTREGTSAPSSQYHHYSCASFTAGSSWIPLS